jgi:hypothetical protein
VTDYPVPPTSFTPPPPPGPPARQTIDFGRPFTFVFDDPDWVRKILLGGLMTLLSFLLIGIFIVFGYCARLARNVAAGVARPLPEWNDIGDYLLEGLKLVVIAIIYYIPVMIVFAIGMGGTAFLGALADDTGADAVAAVAGGMFSIGMCFLYIFALAVAAILPAALTLAVMRQDFGAAFDFRTVFSYIGQNGANYVLAIAVHLIAGFLAQFGFFLLCVGLLFTAFWSQLATTHAFGETYRYSPVK